MPKEITCTTCIDLEAIKPPSRFILLVDVVLDLAILYYLFVWLPEHFELVKEVFAEDIKLGMLGLILPLLSAIVMIITAKGVYRGLIGHMVNQFSDGEYWHTVPNKDNLVACVDIPEGSRLMLRRLIGGILWRRRGHVLEYNPELFTWVKSRWYVSESWYKLDSVKIAHEWQGVNQVELAIRDWQSFVAFMKRRHTAENISCISYLGERLDGVGADLATTRQELSESRRSLDVAQARVLGLEELVRYMEADWLNEDGKRELQEAVRELEDNVKEMVFVMISWIMYILDDNKRRKSPLGVEMRYRLQDEVLEYARYADVLIYELADIRLTRDIDALPKPANDTLRQDLFEPLVKAGLRHESKQPETAGLEHEVRSALLHAKVKEILRDPPPKKAEEVKEEATQI